MNHAKISINLAILVQFSLKAKNLHSKVSWSFLVCVYRSQKNTVITQVILYHQREENQLEHRNLWCYLCGKSFVSIKDLFTDQNWSFLHFSIGVSNTLFSRRIRDHLTKLLPRQSRLVLDIIKCVFQPRCNTKMCTSKSV